MRRFSEGKILREEAKPRSDVVSIPEASLAQSASVVHRSNIATDAPIPTPPFWGSRVVEKIPIKSILSYVNEVMLFQVQWQYKKKGRPQAEYDRYLDAEVRPIYRELVTRCERENILQPQAIYGYWPCQSDGNTLYVHDPADRRHVLATFEFPRQTHAPYWCLSDFWRPKSSGEYDVIAMSIVTAGRRVSEVAREWHADNRYRDYLHLHGLGVECAEALAEYIHKHIRIELGIAGEDAREIRNLFKQGYRGSRYSFGYPACPNLADQDRMWPLLQPERIGVSLTEEDQLEPEQSTSAVIAHHPQARYFKA
jgi:5-methyltetrahydrofolate--homocysteine methyltransferase